MKSTAVHMQNAPAGRIGDGFQLIQTAATDPCPHRFHLILKPVFSPGDAEGPARR